MPLDQLLSLYGCRTQASGPSSSSEVSTNSDSTTSNLFQFDSSTSTRSRRKRAIITGVVPISVATISSSSSPLPPSAKLSDRSSSVAKAKDTTMKVEGTSSSAERTENIVSSRFSETRSECNSRIEVHLKKSSGTSTSSRVTITARDSIISSDETINSGQEPTTEGAQSAERIPQGSSPFKYDTKRESGLSVQTLKHDEGAFSEQDKRPWLDRDAEQEDTTDVEVVEDDGMEVGLEVGLGERDEGLFQLAEMERKGLNVVRMDDIEAGLSKGESFFSPLDLMKKDDFMGGSGASSLGVGLGFAVGGWGETIRMEGGVVEHEEREELGKVEGEGGEAVAEEEEEKKRGLIEGAVYDDVLLSTSSEPHFLSEYSGKCSITRS